jgi:hypothetical protein
MPGAVIRREVKSDDKRTLVFWWTGKLWHSDPDEARRYPTFDKAKRSADAMQDAANTVSGAKAGVIKAVIETVRS